jgi:hypothetical protein
MHRTEAPGAIGGLYAYNQTVIGSAALNAIQEELCNLIELNGGTLNYEADDEAGSGRRQIYDMIYSGGMITDDAIDELTFDIMSGGSINISSGDYTWLQTTSFLNYSDSGEDAEAFLYPSRVSLQHYGAQTRVSGRGIRFPNGPGDDSDFKDAYVRKAFYSSVSLSGTAWSEFVSGSGVWMWNGSFTTEIPFTTRIYGMNVMYNDGSYWYSCSPVCDWDDDGGYWRANSIRISNGMTGITVTDMDLMIEYDASYLVVT